ncbi:hypothetical protein [Kibdelosporangium aridum]|uniref:hypothetical protein n=1 Tax=Kibdelosporangium aridum TaxID=2030 RepID=UPI00117A69A9|nr:hypothetical protein [Kibdelosporangium aridum]
MGIFGKRKPDSVVATPTDRDITRFNPTWFEDQLESARKPVTTHNAAAVAALTSVNLALNAIRWLNVVGTPEVRQRWDNQFGRADEDYAEILARPDKMIDFLWSVSPRLHPGLHQFAETIASTVQSRLRDFDEQLPLDMWTDTR